mgnify:FL=1
MGKILKSILSDSINNTISSKRVVTIFAFILCSVAFLTELFWGHKVSKESFDSMMYIAIAGLGFTASEKFAPGKEPPKKLLE